MFPPSSDEEEPAEVAALPVLVATRNAQTVLNSAHAYAANPDPYVLVSAQPATRLLGQFAKLGDGLVAQALQVAAPAANEGQKALGELGIKIPEESRQPRGEHGKRRHGKEKHLKDKDGKPLAADAAD